MERWRLIPSIEECGAMQMAIDEAMLYARIKGIIPNTLRFFSWKPPAITIGYFQSLKKEVDVKKAKNLGIDVIRRYTGGGAVLHDKELTYSVVMDEKDLPTDIIKSYQKICSCIIYGLKTMGLNAEFKPINDIVVKNKKISGNAQTRKEGIVLQHGTILIDVDVEKMFSVLKVPNEKIKDKLIKDAKERVTSINKELGKNTGIKKLEKSIAKGFEKIFKIKFYLGDLTKEEMKLTRKLYKTKYSTKEWNYLR